MMHGDPSGQRHPTDLAFGPPFCAVPDDDLSRFRAGDFAPPRRDQLHKSGPSERILPCKLRRHQQIFIVEGVPGVVGPDVAQHQQIGLQVPQNLVHRHPMLRDAVAGHAGVHRVHIASFVLECGGQLHVKGFGIVDAEAVERGVSQRDDSVPPVRLGLLGHRTSKSQRIDRRLTAFGVRLHPRCHSPQSRGVTRHQPIRAFRSAPPGELRALRLRPLLEAIAPCGQPEEQGDQAHRQGQSVPSVDHVMSSQSIAPGGVVP